MLRSSKVAEWRSFRIVDEATYQATLQRLSGKERSDVYILWQNCDQFNLKLRFGEYLELKTRHARSKSGVEIWTKSKRFKMTDHKLEKIRELMLTSNEKKLVKAAQHSSSVDLADHHVVTVKKVVQKVATQRGSLEESALQVVFQDGSCVCCTTICFEDHGSETEELAKKADPQLAAVIASGEFVGSYNSFLLHLLKQKGRIK